MNKKYVMLFLIAVMLAAGGCGGSGGGVPDGPSLALLGTIGEEDRLRLEASGISLYRFDYDTSDPDDHPAFLIASDGWDEIGGDPMLMEELSDAYTEGRGKWGRIVLLRPDNDDIDRLTELQGHSFDANIRDEGSVLFYAIGRQSDGNYMIYAEVDSGKVPTVYGSDGEEPEAIESGGDRQPEPDGAVSADAFAQSCEDLREWLLEEDDDREVQNADANAWRTADSGPNLLQMASKWKSTVDYNAWGGNHFRINDFIVAVHEFADEDKADGGNDMYYVEQECIFEAGSSYLDERRWGGHRSRINNELYHVDGHLIEGVIESYRIENNLQYGDADTGSILLSQPQPTAFNNVERKTVGSAHTIGVEVGGGYSAKESGHGEGKLSYGYSCSSSREFETHDVSVEQRSSVLSPRWVYYCKMPEKNPHGNPFSGRLLEGARLGHSTYTPWQTWKWGIPTKYRDTVKEFTLTFTPTFAGVYVRGMGWLTPMTLRTSSTHNNSISLPQPPLLALEKNSLVYGKKAGTQHLSIAAQGGWTSEVISKDIKDWIKITPSPGRLDVQVDENTTGQSRSGNISIKRNNSGDTAQIVVTQLL